MLRIFLPINSRTHPLCYLRREIVSNNDNSGFTFEVMPAVVRAGGIRVCGYNAEHYAWPMITFVEDNGEKIRSIKNLRPKSEGFLLDFWC